MASLTSWQNFYVIVGSSAGAMTGLQFVVMALIADMPRAVGSSQSTDAFGTPTIVHFCAVLLLSGIVSAPWAGILAPAALLAVFGTVGVGYVAIVARRARTQTSYTPVLEDWLFHVILPAAAYATLAVGGFAARSHLEASLFGVAVASMMLLFIGIHNAWDTVTYLVFLRSEHRPNDSESRG
jgi:hypothetical protein